MQAMDSLPMAACVLAATWCAWASVADGAGADVAWPSWPAETARGTLRPARGFVLPAGGMRVPVIASADVLVVDSPLAGCVAARGIAQRGRRGVLASASTSLPREFAPCLRPWVTDRERAAAPKDVQDLLRRCESSGPGPRGMLHMGKVTQAFEDALLDAKVGLFYDLQPCGVQMNGQRVTAVLFACKGGLVAVAADAVIDATPDGCVARLAGAQAVPRDQAECEIRYRMLAAAGGPEGEPALPRSADAAGATVTVRGPFVEFGLKAVLLPGEFRCAAAGLQAKAAAARTAKAMRSRKEWSRVRFARGGDVVLSPPARRLVPRSDGAEGSLDTARPAGVANVFVCGPALGMSESCPDASEAVVAALKTARHLAEADWPTSAGVAPAGPSRVRLTAHDVPASPAPLRRMRFAEVPPIYSTGRSIPIDAAAVPVVASCDVVVVGGGTSGAPAALVAAREGLDTVVIEKHGDVGGTHTIGGVSSYWFGRRTAFVESMDRDAGDMMRQAGMPKCTGMLDLLMRAGVRVITNCLAVGALVADGRVRGVVVTGEAGLVGIEARYVIDATGDGDIAARAGAEAAYGTARDAMTMWYSFGLYKGAGSVVGRQYDSCVDLRDPTDVTRAIVTSRRRPGIFGRGEFPQYYLTPRESRHVLGRATVTYGDILRGRRHRDVVLVCRSNFDIKGLADSDLVRCGYNENKYNRNYDARIPYRALLPRGLGGLLVIGKAYSATHDALSLARMQRDMMAMGAVAGAAAALASKADADFADVEAAALQKRLVGLGVLTDADLADLPQDAMDGPAREGPAERKRRVQLLISGQADLPDRVALVTGGEAAIAALKAALPGAEGDAKIRLAWALCFLGDLAGADAVLAALRGQVSAAALPTRSGNHHAPPDHGYAPEPAYMICLLGRARERRLIPLLEPLARQIRINPARSDQMFEYVSSICYACERLGDSACVPALTVLADKEGIRGGVLPIGTDPRQTGNIAEERCAYLELCVGRALARCGSRQGCEILIGYLSDARGVLARSAQEELAALSGEALGYDAAAWRSWVKSKLRLPRKPWDRRIE